VADEITKRSNEAWEAVAPAWDLNRDRIFEATRAVSDRLVALIDPRPGQRVLEIAAGTGETGFLLAEQLGADGRLISTDFSESMVGAARRGAFARGLSHVECRVMDAQSIDLQDRAVDAVLTRFGLMLIADPSRTLSEAHRVLQPGGRLVYAVWGMPDANPWIMLLALAVLQTGHVLGGDPFGPGGLFSLAEPERNRQLVTAAGFIEVAVEELDGAMLVDDIDDYWDFQASISGPIAVLLAGLSSDEREAVRAAFRLSAAPYLRGAGYELPFRAIIVSGVRR
jgi:ubiquinone/menaquinone biosynthesis C-methylase UbiE